MSRSLYICYFGVREPLVQTQVIPYLRELAKGGHDMSLVTFEGKIDELEGYGVAKLKAELAAQGIDWSWLKYHKSFSIGATAWDIFQGARFVRRSIKRKDLDILHGRSHVPTLMAVLAREFSRRKPKVLFDIRGFFPEEYTDAGIWPENGWLYRTVKWVERWLLKEADGFVVLTERAKEILFGESPVEALGRRPVEVIPCCVDLTRFASANGLLRETVRKELGISDRFVMAYVGAFGGWYLTEETADLFAELKKMRPDAFAMVLTQSKPEVIEPLLRSRGYEEDDYIVRKVLPTEMPRFLSGADAAVSFIKKCYSKQASSPTKNAEYFACGLPIIANAGIGDTDLHIKGTGVGALVDGFSAKELVSAIESIRELGDVKDKCRHMAEVLFDLEKVGGQRYRRIYARLTQ